MNSLNYVQAYFINSGYINDLTFDLVCHDIWTDTYGKFWDNPSLFHAWKHSEKGGQFRNLPRATPLYIGGLFKTVYIIYTFYNLALLCNRKVVFTQTCICLKQSYIIHKLSLYLKNHSLSAHYIKRPRLDELRFNLAFYYFYT